MPRDPDKHPDPATASVSLAAEAALLEARMRMLHEALDTVNACIKAVSDTLYQLHRSASAANAADHEDHGGSSGRDDPSLPHTTHAESG
ncbi:hypothetical protein [Streptomyces sp. NPDC001970]